MKRTGLLLFLCMLFYASSAQENFKISKPEPTFSNNTLIIKYDITGCGSGEFVNIKLIVLNSKGDTLRPVYISGDIGLRVNCGFGKTIVWDLARDKVKIDEDIQIIIKGEKFVPAISTIVVPEQKKITRGNILLSSGIIPGLGQKKASGKPVYLVFSGLVYGSLGASCYYNFIKSKQLKKDYLAASGTQRDDMYIKWENSYNRTKYFIYGAAGAWAVNLIWSAVIPIKENPVKRMDIGLTSSRKNELLVSARWTF
jgi:hypothetical protein